MKRWAYLTAVLYALALLLLTTPIALLLLGNWGKREMNFGGHEALQLYANWGYWLWLSVLVAGQFLLLLLPINIAERRLPARRPVKVTIIVTAFFLANLCFAGIFSLLCVFLRDKAFDLFDATQWFQSNQAENNSNSGNAPLYTMLATMLLFWVIWTVVFFRNFAQTEPEALVKRLTRWLLRGSILELLVAVPSHIIVRRRDDCCAPIGTFWGIVTGLSVMLLCFGPGVFFLFADRCRKPKPAGTEKKVE